MARKPRAEYEITAEDKSAAALRQAEAGLKAVASNVAGFAAGATGAMAGLAVAITKIGANLDDLAKTAKSAGLGVEVFQAWQYAATQSGVAAESFSSAMVRANTAIGQAASGSGPALKVLNDLGIAVRDVNGDVRSTESVFRDFVGAVSRLETPAEQAAASAALFGRSAGPEMALLLREGTGGLKEFEDRARSLGLIISQEATVNADAFMDKMDEMRQIVNAQLANAIFENAEAIEDLATAMGAVVKVAVGGAAGVTNFMRWLGEEFAARIGGIAANDLPRLTQQLNLAKSELGRLQALADKGILATNRGLTPEEQLAAATAEVERWTAALQRGQDMAARGQGMGQLGKPTDAPKPEAVNAPPPAGLTEDQITAAADRERKFNELRLQIARDFNVAIEAERKALDEEEERLFQERLARAAGYATIEAQDAAAREQELWAAKMERRAIQFEEEIAIELGYKDARDRALQESEQAHQDALLEIRTRQFGQFQKMAMDLAKFEQKTAREKTMTALSYAQQLTAGMAQNSKTMFNLNKAAAIAEAIINTATGVTAALRMGPQGIPLAALIAAQGAAQIATISSTQFGGAASGLTSSGPGTGIPSMAGQEMFAPPTVSAEERNNSTIRIEIVGGSDSEIVRSIIKQARVVTDDEDEVLASGRSRQAMEFA